MSRDRASIFGTDDDFDVSGFAPKAPAAAEKPAAKREQVRAVSEAASFRSREPKAAPAAPAARSEREPRRYRTGRNVQLNIKAKPETLEAFYAHRRIGRLGAGRNVRAGDRGAEAGAGRPKMKNFGAQGTQSLPCRLAPTMRFSGKI